MMLEVFAANLYVLAWALTSNTTNDAPILHFILQMQMKMLARLYVLESDISQEADYPKKGSPLRHNPSAG